MGARVREPNKVGPEKYVWTICPHCNHSRKVINGAWLRWKREKAEIDQRTLAKMFDLSGSYLSDIERNRRECPESIKLAYSKLR